MGTDKTGFESNSDRASRVDQLLEKVSNMSLGCFQPTDLELLMRFLRWPHRQCDGDLKLLEQRVLEHERKQAEQASRKRAG